LALKRRVGLVRRERISLESKVRAAAPGAQQGECDQDPGRHAGCADREGEVISGEQRSDLVGGLSGGGH